MLSSRNADATGLNCHLLLLLVFLCVFSVTLFLDVAMYPCYNAIFDIQCGGIWTLKVSVLLQICCLLFVTCKLLNDMKTTQTSSFQGRTHTNVWVRDRLQSIFIPNPIN